MIDLMMKTLKIFFLMNVPILFILVYSNCQTTKKKDSSNNDISKNWVKGKGRAQIYQNDVSHAKDRAIRDAKKDAIRRKLGDLIKSKTITESGVWLKGEISAKTEGLVKDYKLTSEIQSSELYKVEIMADVYESDLVDQVDSLLSDWESPVLFFIVKEKYAGKSHSHYDNDTTQALSEFFINKKFIINKTSKWQSLLKPPVKINKISKLISKNISVDFDLLVFGDTECSNSGKVKLGGSVTNMTSAQISSNISIFDIHTQRLIASASVRKPNAHIDFKFACKNGIRNKIIPSIAEQLFSQMLVKWGKEYGSGKAILLNISGKFSYEKLYQFKIDLGNEVRGVVDVIERSFKPNKAMFEVIYNGKVEDFVEEISNKELTFRLKIINKSGRRLSVKARLRKN